ncbi:MAG: hypothetical protein ACYTJ0_05495 [Planctomycetota bacterium]|jgi:hypothetical protein
MWYLSTLLFVCGLAAYVASLSYMASGTGETLSDVGNACMLMSIASVTLWRLRPRRSDGGPPAVE